jgi:hypothetical protein
LPRLDVYVTSKEVAGRTLGDLAAQVGESHGLFVRETDRGELSLPVALKARQIFVEAVRKLGLALLSGGVVAASRSGVSPWSAPPAADGTGRCSRR